MSQRVIWAVTTTLATTYWRRRSIRSVVAVVVLGGRASAAKTESCRDDWSRSDCMRFERLVRPPWRGTGSRSDWLHFERRGNRLGIGRGCLSGSLPTHGKGTGISRSSMGGDEVENLLGVFRVRAADACSLRIAMGSFPSREKVFLWTLL